MSRWSRKSDKEKKDIHDNQSRQKEGQTMRKNAIDGDYLGVARRFSDMKDDTEQWTKVVNSGNIPIFCPYDGWVGCNKYEVKLKEILPGAGDYVVVEGNCMICQRPITKAIDGWSSETMIIMQLISQLKREGRLVDKR